MILFNKLIRIDLIFALTILSLFFLKSGALRDGILGFSTALFIISIVNHIRHYSTYKKLY